MYADFRGATRGMGKSFKGALDYFLNDKGEEGQDRPKTDERVDVLELRNLATDNARHAWFEMMSTAQASEALKEAAGIKRGGRRGENPVFTYHLAWHDSERPARAEMLAAAQSTLRRLGLENHQALIVSHTDTAHPHVHVIVNRVNPEDGRYAGLPNSWKMLKEWAIEYSRERGTHWHIPLEQAKEARDQRKQTECQARFNRSAQGKSSGRAEQGTRGKASGRAEWQARKDAGRDSDPAEAAAAAILKAGQSAKWKAFRQYQRELTDKYHADKERFWQDRKALRAAIYQKYVEANKAVWSQPRVKPLMQQRPKPSRAAEKTVASLSESRTRFNIQEQTFAGRIANAARLGKAAGMSPFGIILLAMNPHERRRLFDVEQRRVAAQGRRHVEQKVKAAWVPETRRMQADRLKVMRTAELAAFDRMTGKLQQDLAERQQMHTAGLTAMKAALSASGKAAWAKHAEAFRGPKVREQRRPADEQTTDRRQRPPEDTRDRFGRSRDRKPRQPRSERQERAGRAEGAATARTGMQRPHSGPQAARGTAEAFREASSPEDGPSQLDRAEAAYVRSDAEKAAYERVKTLREAEREANERSDERGLGREREL